MTSESQLLDENFSFLQGSSSSSSTGGAHPVDNEVMTVLNLDSTLNISNINDVSISTQKRRGTVKVVPSRYLTTGSRTREAGTASSSRETLSSTRALEKSHVSSTSRSSSKMDRTGQSTTRTASSRLTITPAGSSTSSSSATASAGARTSRTRPTTQGTSSSSRTTSGTSSSRRQVDTTATSSNRLTTTRVGTGSVSSKTPHSSSKTVKERPPTSTEARTARSGQTGANEAVNDAKKQASRNAKLAKRLQVFNHEMDILYSYRLQWELINARAEQASAKQRAEVERQLYAATQKVARLREEVAREQALLEKDKYTLHLEEVINTQASLDKISTEFTELASAVEATTHRLPTTGILVPPPDQLLQELSVSERTLNEILAFADPHIDQLGQYAASMEGLTAVLSEELRELEQCKELLTTTSMLESHRRSLLIHYMQEHGCRPDSHVDADVC